MTAFRDASFTLLGWTHTATLAPRLFLICCAFPSDFQSFFIGPPELSGNYKWSHLVAKHEKRGTEMAVEFCLRSVSAILSRVL